jgi:hypothetical protein
MNSSCIMIIICRAIVWALNCLNYLSLQKSPATDNSVALQKMQYVVNSSHGLLVILYVPFIMMFLLSVALQKLQYVVNWSHGLLVILYVPFIMMLFWGKSYSFLSTGKFLKLMWGDSGSRGLLFWLGVVAWSIKSLNTCCNW